MPRYPYELVGGHAVLDFVNTVQDRRVDDPVDRLGDYADVVTFAAAAGVVSGAEARRLSEHADAGELRQLRALRERLARIFETIVSSSTADSDDLDELARDAARAASVTRLRRGRGGIVRTIDADAAVGPSVVRWRLADAAVALLTSERMSGVKACPNCGWFFLDSTKNRSRRWCSMSMCGSVIKARRYYRRKKR